jgi:hypothetical protein
MASTVPWAVWTGRRDSFGLVDHEPVEVRDDVVGAVEDRRVLGAAVAAGEVGGVMADQQEGATGGERAHRVAERRRERLGRQLQVEDRHQVEPGGGGRYVVTSARIHSTVTWVITARSR